MATIDPEHERRRLAEFYASEMDGRLERIAGQAYELSEIAREALRAELGLRGLSTPLAERPPENPAPPPSVGEPPPEPPAPKEPTDGEFEFRRRFTIRTFRDLPEALVAKATLLSTGIDCTLIDDNVVRMDWLWSNLVGGVKLLVDEGDAAAANDVLAQPIPEHLDVSGEGDYEQPRCPRCGSLDVNFRESSPAAYITLWLLVPIPFHRRAWRCRTCYAEWEVVPDPAQSTG